jgi:hypothetical protein
MHRSGEEHSSKRLAVLCWTARIGAVTAEALAERDGSSVASARARLCAAERQGLLVRSRPLTGRPALFAITRPGLRACGLPGLLPTHVTAANAAHAIACASVAAALERSYPDHRVMGEPELRRAERERHAPIPSARLGTGQRGVPLLHRPDLALWPRGLRDGLPVAVEVELTVKAPRRLLSICRAWARCRTVAGVLYLATPEVERALQRALAAAHAGESIAVAPLAALTGEGA